MSKAPLSTTQPAKAISISPLSYRPEIPGEERPEENILAEQALENMMGALERRKQKPFLDPTMLQLAAGFLAPTRTGSAFESIGNAARAYAGAKELERQREAEDIAFETGVLGQASAIAQSRARDLAFRTGMEQDPRFGLTVKGSEVLTPEGLKEVVGNIPGVFVAPPNPNFPDSKSLLNSIWREGKKSHSEALKEVADLEYKRYDIKDGSVFDRRTGLGWKIPTGERVEFTGANGSTYKVPAEDAVYLYHQQRHGKVNEYNERAKTLNLPLLQAPSGASARAEAPSGAPARLGAPAGAPSGAPAGGLKSEAQKSEEKVRRERRAEEETKLDVEAEAALGSNSKAAREMFNAAQRLQKATTESPMVFGLLQSPTIGNAILSLIDEGIQAGNTTIRLGGLQSAILKSIPGVTKNDITNLERAYSALAEIELKYTQLYLKGQGQVTEGERLIVRKLAGTEKNTPEFLNTQAKLIQMRSQYDIDVIDTFRRLKDQNPDMTWTQFQRGPAYRAMEDDFNKQIAKEFDLEPAVPSRGRGASKNDPFNLESFNQTLKERKGQ
jgi:hypothetical protein